MRSYTSTPPLLMTLMGHLASGAPSWLILTSAYLRASISYALEANTTPIAPVKNMNTGGTSENPASTRNWIASPMQNSGLSNTSKAVSFRVANTPAFF